MAFTLRHISGSFTFLPLAAALLASGCVADPEGERAAVDVDPLVSPTPAPAAADIADELRQLPSVLQVTEAPSRYAGTRFFVIRFEQPVSHFEPWGPKFSQRLTFLYRSKDAPNVLATTGYDIHLDATVRGEAPE